MKKTTVLVFSALIATSALSLAEQELESMSKAQIEHVFVNHTGTSIPTVRLNDVPIPNVFKFYMDDKGHIFGKFARKPKNQPQKDQGSYTISDDGELQVTWQHWDFAKPLCFYLYDTQNDYLSLGCDKRFHTAFVKASMQAGNQLKA